jgi:hypothetical protein
MSRRRVAVVGAVVAAAIGVPVLTEATASRGRYVAAPASCGTARWPVKTLSDSAAASLDTRRLPTTVVGLSAFRAPAHIGNTLPRQAGFGGAEFKLYTETVRLVGWKTEADSDIHVEVRALAGLQTMVVEFPLAGCIRESASPSNRARMAAAKAALLKACGPAPGTSDLSPLKGVATVTGVGFYDKRSHATGSAVNGIELHPVIAFTSTTCRAGP